MLAWARTEEGWPATRLRLGLAAALGTAAGAAGAGLLLASAWLVSRAAEHPPVLYLMVAIVAVRAFGLARGVLRYAERLVGHDAAFRLLVDLRVAVYRRLEPLAPVGLGRTRRGDVVSRVVSDVDAVQDLVLRSLLPLVATGGVCIGVTALVAAVLPSAGLVLAAAVLVMLLAVPIVVRAVGRRSERDVAPLRGHLAAVTAELVDAGPELVVNGATGPGLERFDRAVGRLHDAERAGAGGAGAAGALVLLTVGAGVVGSAALASSAVADQTLAPVWLAVVVLAPLALHEALAGVPDAVRHRDRAGGAVARVAELVSLSRAVPSSSGHAPVPAGAAEWRAAGLSVGWPGGSDVIRGLDLVLARGSRTAVVGPSGSGKSTLAAALARLLPARGGSLTLGGIDVGSIEEADLRGRVALLDQQAHVFDTTIRENLRIGRVDATAGQLWSALGQAGLADFVATLPDGLDTDLGEGGGRLSGGERQRLALARLLLADPDLVVLDEPTEHLDDDTSAALVRDLLALAPRRTVVLITHGRHGLDDVDQVVRLGRGRSPTGAGRPRMSERLPSRDF